MQLLRKCVFFTARNEVGRGSLSGGVSVQGDPHLPPYGYVRAVRILLECILVHSREWSTRMKQKSTT